MRLAASLGGWSQRPAGCRRLLMSPVNGGDPVTEALKPRTGPYVGATGAVVADFDAEVALALSNVDLRSIRAGVLRDVGERLGDGEVRGGFDRHCEPLRKLGAKLDGDGGVVREA